MNLELHREPIRAHHIVLRAGGDTAEDLAAELRSMADQLERGELSVGCTASPSSGAIYSYCVAPKTHSDYFAALEEELGRLRAEKA